MKKLWRLSSKLEQTLKPRARMATLRDKSYKPTCRLLTGSKWARRQKKDSGGMKKREWPSIVWLCLIDMNVEQEQAVDLELLEWAALATAATASATELVQDLEEWAMASAVATDHECDLSVDPCKSVSPKFHLF
mmetsp:Transcript_73795/g.117436  ORF Transcript_73795/g.117436 Transcript_73795/m.117436 type:complete len:134 (-) Transcript_73795:54-455(-)